MSSLPVLGPLSSWLFVFKPQWFLDLGRAKAARAGARGWWFTLDGNPMLALGDGEAADAIADASVYYRFEVLEPALGPWSPIGLEKGSPIRAADLSRRFRWPKAAEITEIIRDCLPTDLHRVNTPAHLDIAPFIYRAALSTILHAVRADSYAALIAAEAMLSAADTPALVAPKLRHWRAFGWHEFPPTRERFIKAAELDDLPGPARDLAVTAVFGVDNLAMLALATVASSATTRKHRLEGALSEPPTPFLFRRLVRPVEIDGIGQLMPGCGVAIDAGAAKRPFGIRGSHYCFGESLARTFAETVDAFLNHLELKVAVKPKKRRRRLSWGIDELIVCRP